MNGLTKWEGRKWNPFKEMEDLHQHLVSTLFGRSPLRGNGESQEHMTVGEWAPLVDITENDAEYLITVEVPEVRKENLKVNVENGVLTITGERKLEKEEEGRKYHRIERSYGTFVRSFTLPDNADGSKVNAEFKEGLLKVHVAKDERAKPRAIDVKIS